MKYQFILLVSLLILVGCSQLMRGQEQPVVTKNAKESVYFTTCSGAVENWGTCSAKALRTCVKGYSIVEKTENANGGFRTLTFKCN